MMGCIVGRFINRIAGASFPLNGSTVRLTPNMPTGAAIHGGGADGGWCMRRWNVTRTTADSVTFALTSPAGDQGFPGGVNASVTYSLSADDTVTAVLTATADALTAANIAPHPYFNLDGAAARTHVRGHELASPATLRTVVDVGSLLPTGAVVAVAGTAFDFQKSTLLGARWDAIPPDATEPGVGGYEVQYVLGGAATGATARAAVVNCSRPGPPTPAATLTSPSTGRTLTLATNAPALVVYTSTHLGGGGYVPKGGGTPYPQYSAVALEPQDPTDWVHHTDTFSTCYLSPRESMRRVWTLKVGVEGRNG
jgi:aldose 1-epimerase